MICFFNVYLVIDYCSVHGAEMELDLARSEYLIYVSQKRIFKNEMWEMCVHRKFIAFLVCTVPCTGMNRGVETFINVLMKNLLLNVKHVHILIGTVFRWRGGLVVSTTQQKVPGSFS